MTCMSSLAHKSAHVSYRDSKLTHMLADALGGKPAAGGAVSRTLFFVHLAPEAAQFHDTLATLRFAEKLKTVETNVHHNTNSCNHSNTSAAAAGATTDDGVTRRSTRRK